MADMRKQSVDKGKAKHEEVKELYKLLPTKDGHFGRVFRPKLEWTSRSGQN